MSFLIQPHVRLQEWVAEEHGYFREAGLDYEFEPRGLAGSTVSTSPVRTADALTAQWQAAETSQLRPFCMSSKAPLATSMGASSAVLTGDVLTVEPARPRGSNS